MTTQNMTSRIAPVVAFTTILLGGLGLARATTHTTIADQPAAARSVADGVYTQAQQKRGEEIYTRECSTCHGATMRGGEGSPGLTGADFAASWNGQTVADLFDTIRQTMPAPPEQPGKLSPQQNADVVAHILSGNAFPAGRAELPTNVDELKRIGIVVKP